MRDIGSSPSATEFEELVLPLLGSLYNLARWLTRNPYDAEDLVQETLLKAYKAFRSFEAGTHFRAWIFRILRNTFLSSRAGQKAFLSISLDATEGDSGLAVEFKTPETLLVHEMGMHKVENAIQGLPVHYREVLILCDVEEMSYKQISEVLSVPIGTVMSRLARARKLMRESLATQKKVLSRGGLRPDTPYAGSVR